MGYMDVLDWVFIVSEFGLGVCIGLLVTNWWIKKRYGIDVLSGWGKKI